MSNTERERYQRIVDTLGQVPTLPAVVSRIVQIINDPKSSADSASKIIEKDVALSSKVLRLANSAFYGIPRTISSTTSAIVILGFNTIRSLILSASVMKIFPENPDSIQFDRKTFWKHSMMTGIATRMLAKHYQRNRLVDLEVAFCAGLLHDVGKLILEQFAHEDYLPVLSESRRHSLPLAEAELKLLGITHADISGMLMDKWDMPLELKIPVSFHHKPREARDHTDLASLVHFADYLCHLRGSGCMEQEPIAPLDQMAVDSLNLGCSEEELRAELEVQVENAAPFFALADED